jgi:hypothetical protein
LFTIDLISIHRGTCATNLWAAQTLRYICSNCLVGKGYKIINITIELVLSWIESNWKSTISNNDYIMFHKMCDILSQLCILDPNLYQYIILFIKNHISEEDETSKKAGRINS